MLIGFLLVMLLFLLIATAWREILFLVLWLTLIVIAAGVTTTVHAVHSLMA